MTITIQTLADAIFESPYFNDQPITFPPFADDMPPTFRTLNELDAYARDPFAMNHNRPTNEPLRDRLADALADDICDLAHNSNYDDFLPADFIDLDDDDAIAELDKMLNESDELYSIIADKLLARATSI